MRRRWEWGTVAAVGRRRPPWLGCIFLPSFHLGTSRVTPKTTLKPTQNQPMSHLISPSIMGGWGRFKQQSSSKTCWLAPATRCRVNYLLLPRHLASIAIAIVPCHSPLLYSARDLMVLFPTRGITYQTDRKNMFYFTEYSAGLV